MTRAAKGEPKGNLKHEAQSAGADVPWPDPPSADHDPSGAGQPG